MHRMNGLLRLLLIALLVASLPVRGYAAAGMLAGAGAHGAAPAHAGQEHAAHASHEAARPAAVHDHAAMHDHVGTHDHLGAHDHAALPQAPADQAAPHHPRGADATAESGSCSYCGDCCSAGALQSFPLTPGSFPVVTRVESLPLLAPASFVADLLVPPPNRRAA